MAKLTPRKMARRDGTLNINGYTLTLAKVPTEQAGFDEKSNVEVEYSKNKIIVKKI